MSLVTADGYQRRQGTPDRMAFLSTRLTCATRDPRVSANLKPLCLRFFFLFRGPVYSYSTVYIHLLAMRLTLRARTNQIQHGFWAGCTVPTSLLQRK